MQEVIDLLDKARKELYSINLRNVRSFQITRPINFIQEALAKLREEPTELKLPVFLPDDYDGLYSVAQALSKRFMELYAENKELESALDMAKIHNAVIKKNRNEFFDETVRLQAQIAKLVEGQQAKTIAGSGGKVNDGTIR